MLSLIATLFLIEASSAATQPLILYTEENPPYTSVSQEDGRVRGAAITIVTELMRRTTIPYRIEVLPWNRAFQLTQSTPHSCLFIMDQTPEREANFHWISPIVETGWSLYKRPDSDITISSLDQLAPYSVVGTMGFASSEAIAATGHQKLLLAGSNTDAIKLLYRGRVDLWVVGDYEAGYLASANDLPTPIRVFPIRDIVSSMGCNLETDLGLINELKKANDTMAVFRQEVFHGTPTP